MATQQTPAFSFLKDHPKLCFLLLLLLTPPLFSIIFHFTPLLLSTALCVFALISLSPYFTATDHAEDVERQSNKGASSGPNVVESSKRARVEEAAAREYNITSTVFSSAPETSWFSWMKGLNDVGRTWVESKLREEGLALSEPANRETLLALIQGSFAELVTAKGHPLELLSLKDGNAEADGSSVFASQTQEIQEGLANDACGDGFFKKRGAVGSGAYRGGGLGDTDKNSNEEVGDSFIKLQACDKRACEMSLAHGENYALLPDFHRVDAAPKRSVKQAAAGHECFSASADGPPKPPALMGARNPSKTPTSKLLEASRRIFTREDSKAAMVFRAPASEAPASKLLDSSGSISSKGESKRAVAAGSGTPIKALSRKLLEAARSNASKAGSKAGAMAASSTGTPIMKGPVRKAPESCRSIVSCKEEGNEADRAALEAPASKHHLEASSRGGIANKAKFGDDVKEAQGGGLLVRRSDELTRMVEMEEEEEEEEEVSSLKLLPKQGDYYYYKRTPSRVRREGTGTVASSPATSTTTAAAASRSSSPLFPTLNK